MGHGWEEMDGRKGGEVSARFGGKSKMTCVSNQGRCLQARTSRRNDPWSGQVFHARSGLTSSNLEG